MIFLIWFPSTLIRNATFIDQNLEKSQNIKDFLGNFNPFLHTFFSKLNIYQNLLKSMGLWYLNEGNLCLLVKYNNRKPKRLPTMKKSRILLIDVLRSIDVLRASYLYSIQMTFYFLSSMLRNPCLFYRAQFSSVTLCKQQR